MTSGDVPAATEASLLGKAQQLRQTFARRSVKIKLPKFIAVVLVLTSVAIPVLAGAGVRAHRLDVTDGNVLVADPINQQLVEYNSLTEQVVSTINARQLGDAAFSVKQNGGGNPVVHDETNGAVLAVDQITGALGTAVNFPTTEIRVGVAGDRSFVAELPSGKVTLFDPTRLNATGDTVEIGSAITDVAVDSSRGLQVLTTAGELVSVSSNDSGGASKETSRVAVTKSAANARVVTNNNDTLIVEPGRITRVRNGVIVAKSDTPNDGAIKVPEQSVAGDLLPVLSSAAGIVLLVIGDAQPQRIDLKDPNAFTAAPIVLNGRVYLRNDRTRQMIVLNATGSVIQTIFIPGSGSIDVTVDEGRIWINPGGSEGLIIVRPDGSVITKARGIGDGSVTGGVLGGGASTVTDTAPPRTVATTSTTTSTTAVPAVAATKPGSSAVPSTLASTPPSTATPTTTALISTTTVSPGSPATAGTIIPTTTAPTTTTTTTPPTTTPIAPQRTATTPPVLTPPTLPRVDKTTTTQAPDDSDDTEIPTTRPPRVTTPKRDEPVVTRPTVPPTTTTTVVIDFPVLPRPEPTTTTAATTTSTPTARPGVVPTIPPSHTGSSSTTTSTPTTKRGSDATTTTLASDETTTTTSAGNGRTASSTTRVPTSSTPPNGPSATSVTSTTSETTTTTTATTKPDTTTASTTTTRPAPIVEPIVPSTTRSTTSVAPTAPTTARPTTTVARTTPPTTVEPSPTTSNVVPTVAPTAPPTTARPTTIAPTTPPTTARPTTVAPTTPPTTVAPTTPPTTARPTTVAPTTPPTTVTPTTVAPTTPPTTARPTTIAPTAPPTTVAPTTTAGTTTTTTAAISLPGAPTGLNAFLTGGGKIVSMSWTAPSTGGPVTSYKITTSFGDNITTASTSDAVSAIGENLGIPFTFTVEAIGPVGAGPMRSFSRTLGTTPPVTTTTAATTTTTVAPTTTLAPTTTVPPTSPPPVTTTTVTTTTIAPTTTVEPTTTLAPTTIAPTTVAPTAPPTTVAPTTTVTTIPVNAIPPGAVTNLYAEGDGTGAYSVYWAAPVTGGTATEYRVTGGPNGPQITTDLGISFYFSVNKAIRRTFTVVAINSFGEGPPTSFRSNREGGSGGPCGDGTVLPPGASCP